MLIPIGRDDAEVRRTPWISWTIIALNFVIFLAVAGASRNGQKELEPKAVEALRYLVDHPYLEIPDALGALLPGQVVAQFRQARAESRRPVPAVVEREQEELDGLARSVVEIVEASPHFAWGYKPAKASVVTLFSSMFVHAGLLHLLGNMLFFFVSAPFIEDVYGRVVFPVLYFAGGTVATWSWAGLHPDASQPLVGASGAIAAVMGAYLVRFHKSKIEFLWLPFVIPIVRSRFFMPAYVVLPFWFAEQAWLARQETEASGVAFSAHVGGFVFGAVFGLAMRVTSVEDRFVNPQVEAQTSWKESAEYLRALESRDRGDLTAARRNVDAAMRIDPKSLNAMLLAMEVGWTMGDASYASRQSMRLLDEYVRRQEEDLARGLIDEISRDWDEQADARFFARAAACADRWGDARLAMDLRSKAATRDAEGTIAIPALIRIAKDLRSKGDVYGARSALEKALGRPAMTESWKSTIDTQLAEMSDSPWAPM